MMLNVPERNTEDALRVPRTVANGIGRENGWLRSVVSRLPARSRLMPVGYSFADQALAVGANFLANVMLAPTQTKEEHGIVALPPCVSPPLAAPHNSPT